MNAGVCGIHDCLEENHLFLPCNNVDAFQEKKPVKTSYTKIRRSMAIVLLVKTFYTQITILCNMTTDKNNSEQRSDVLRRENTVLLRQLNTVILPPPFCTARVYKHQY